jgi:hypothetical protein
MVLAQPAPFKYNAWCSKKQAWFSQAGKCITQDSNGVRAAKVHKLLRDHLTYCVSCPRFYGEISRWGWNGEDDVEMMDIEITGWEMFEEIERRSMA